MTSHLPVARERTPHVLGAQPWFAEAGIEPLIQLAKPEPIDQERPADGPAAGAAASSQPKFDADVAVDTQRSLPLPGPAG